MNAAMASRLVVASTLARTAFMHHDDKGHSTLKQYADIKGSKDSLMRMDSGRSMIYVTFQLLNDEDILGAI